MFKQNMNRISKILKRSIEKGETREFVKKMKNDPNSTYNKVKRAVDTTLQEAQNNNDLRQALRQSLSMDAQEKSALNKQLIKRLSLLDISSK